MYTLQGQPHRNNSYFPACDLIVTITEPISPDFFDPIIHVSSHFIKNVKTTALYVYNETVPVRIEKVLLLHSSGVAELRHGAGLLTQPAAFGSVSHTSACSAELLRDGNLI